MREWWRDIVIPKRAQVHLLEYTQFARLPTWLDNRPRRGDLGDLLFTEWRKKWTRQVGKEWPFLHIMDFKEYMYVTGFDMRRRRNPKEAFTFPHNNDCGEAWLDSKKDDPAWLHRWISG